ncbi:hypothetical protein MTR_3g049103 [Medicago truncatula]|uniref:Uncharacterized protein n=1 Tax=Medicago truncatula TaxID=3880 RepID=A0A072UXB5_MEDTR|nr:hypothetical protein MTR_3g049103 [Medicago truncatula]
MSLLVSLVLKVLIFAERSKFHFLSKAVPFFSRSRFSLSIQLDQKHKISQNFSRTPRTKTLTVFQKLKKVHQNQQFLDQFSEILWNLHHRIDHFSAIQKRELALKQAQALITEGGSEEGKKQGLKDESRDVRIFKFWKFFTGKFIGFAGEDEVSGGPSRSPP